MKLTINAKELTINAKELKKWNACCGGLNSFQEIHKEKTVSLKAALETNSVNDFLYVFLRNKENFSDAQVKDLKLLLCDYAEHVLHIFESKYPEDKRPRTAIETARKYINTCDSSAAAFAAANAAAFAADAAAAHAASAAANAAADAAHAAVAADASAAVNAANREEEQEWQKQKLIDVIEQWERESTCDSCAGPIDTLMDNGDGKKRCIKCSYAKYKESPFSNVKLTRPPIIDPTTGA